MALTKKPIEIVNQGTYPLLVSAKHWKRIPLGEVAEVQNGFAFSSAHFTKDIGVPLIRIRDIFSSDTENLYSGEYSSEYVVKKNDMLIGMDGDFKVSKWPGKKGLLNQRVCRLKIISNDYDRNFLYYVLQPYLDAIHAETSSVTVKHLSSRTIQEIPLPFPTLVEQQKIVAKIEALFTELDAGVEKLKAAQQQLKVYRQAVLKAAFEGRLTNTYLTRNILTEFSEMQLGDFIVKIEAGKSIKCDERPPSIDEVGIVKVSAVTWGEFDEQQSKTITHNDYFNENFLIGEGDFLFSRANTIDLVGSAVIVRTINKKLMLSDKILRFKFKPDLLPWYILYFLRSQTGRKEIQNLSTGNQESMRNIGQSGIRKINFPFCLKSQQQSIVTAIETRLTACEAMEKEIEVQLSNAAQLRQSILKKAFSGELI